MAGALIRSCNAEGRLYWADLLLEKHYHQFTGYHNHVIWYTLKGCLIFFFNVFRSVIPLLVKEISGSEVACAEWSLLLSSFWATEISALERLLSSVFMWRVFLTGSQCSDCRVSYYGEAFPLEGLCSTFWRASNTACAQLALNLQFWSSFCTNCLDIENSFGSYKLPFGLCHL